MRYLLIIMLCACQWGAIAQCPYPTNAGVDGTISGSGPHQYFGDVTLTSPSPSSATTVDASATGVEFVAGYEVYLLPGTWIEPGAEFHAYIDDPCPTPKNAVTANTTELSVFNIHPNPFQNAVQIDFQLDAAQAVSFQIFDLSGKEVHSQTAKQFGEGQHTLQVDLLDLAPGTYLVKGTLGENAHIARIVKL